MYVNLSFPKLSSGSLSYKLKVMRISFLFPFWKIVYCKGTYLLFTNSLICAFFSISGTSIGTLPYTRCCSWWLFLRHSTLYTSSCPQGLFTRSKTFLLFGCICLSLTHSLAFCHLLDAFHDDHPHSILHCILPHVLKVCLLEVKLFCS